jgi:molybdate transport system substrate-binding protein
MRWPALLLFVLLAVAPAGAQTPVHVALFASGTLRGAFADIIANFTRQTGIIVDQTYGASPQLRQRIERGETADVFAADDTLDPRRLQTAGKAGDITIFAHNRVCLLVKPLAAGTHSVVDIMLDGAVRLITAVPLQDAAGDLAEETFEKIDEHLPGGLTDLDAKALRLYASAAAPVPANADAGTYLLLTSNQGDALLTWCTTNAVTAAANPMKLDLKEMPAAISVTANYGLTLRTGAPPAAAALRDFILSPASQKILEQYGFTGA